MHRRFYGGDATAFQGESLAYFARGVTTGLNATFTASNGTSLSGYVPEIGGAFALAATGGVTPVWTIQSNAAICGASSPSSTERCVAYSESSLADGTMTATISVPDFNNEIAGVCLRAQDASNYPMVTALAYSTNKIALQIITVTAGSAVGGAFIDVLSQSAGDHTLQVVLSGSSVTIKLDGVTRITTTNTSFQTATKHGVATNVYDPGRTQMSVKDIAFS